MTGGKASGSAAREPVSDMSSFVRLVMAQGARHHRELPWRLTRDAYRVLVSEVMLQQTQATRVVAFYERWLEEFPTLEALAAAPLEAVLRAWQGLGYNRRAVALKRLAELVVARHAETGGAGPADLPRDDAALRELPGVGPATAAGVRAFAFGQEAVYLETNVRTVFLHEFFADADGVPDSQLLVLVAEAASAANSLGVDPGDWNRALLDYGYALKRQVPNPSRRSAHHVRQSPFEGSRRQRRSMLLRRVLDGPGVSAEDLAADAGLDTGVVLELLEELEREGFIVARDGGWRIA